jgi:hypothetical protein
METEMGEGEEECENSLIQKNLSVIPKVLKKVLLKKKKKPNTQTQP